MTLLQCVHCGHEQIAYMPPTSRYYDLGGAAILTCRNCYGSAFRITGGALIRPRAENFATYAYGSMGEYTAVEEAEATATATATKG